MNNQIPPEPELHPSIELGNRSLFDQLEPKAYLNFAALTPPSIIVKKAIENWTSDYATNGISAYFKWARQRERLRDKIANLLGCKNKDIGFGNGTSCVISDIAIMINWGKNDRIILFNGDFPSVIYPFQDAAKMFDLSITMQNANQFLENSEDGLTILENELKKGGVRIVALSSTFFQTGFLMPIKKIANLCNKYSAEILVDAAQSFGSIPINVIEEGIDYLVAPTHKWLMGLEGAAVLYINPKAMEKLVIRRSGWLSYENAMDFLHGKPGLLRYDLETIKRPAVIEMAVNNSIGFAALEAGIIPHIHLGIKNIYQYVQSLNDALEEGLESLGFKSMRSSVKNERSSILSFLPPDGYETQDISAEMASKKISISTPDGYMRFSPSWPTNISEVRYIIDVAKSFLSK